MPMYEAKTDVDDISSYLIGTIDVLEHLKNKLRNDPVFLQEAARGSIFSRVKAIHRLASEINESPDLPSVSTFQTQQG